MIDLAKLQTQNVPVPAGHQLLGWIDKHPTGKGSGYAVLLVIHTGVEVAWDGTATRSLPKKWRDKVTFEAACEPASVRKNITQPADWWAAFEIQATAEGLTLAAWLGEAAKAKLPPKVVKKLSERPPSNRPKKTE